MKLNMLRLNSEWFLFENYSYCIFVNVYDVDEVMRGVFIFYDDIKNIWLNGYECSI